MSNSTNKKMSPWAVIMRRELSSYFTSPVAYIVSALFLIFSGFLFFSTFFLVGRAELRHFFETLPLLFAFFVPALTMRVFSEEKKTGTIETLVTLPVSTMDIVIGKYVASFVSCVLLLVPTLFYAVTCIVFSSGVDFGPMVGGYLGAVLLAASFSAIGIFASAVTKNQIIAFFLAFSICACLTLINAFAVLLPGFFVSFATFISATSHFVSVSRGIVDLRDILYFLTMIFIFGSVTVYMIEREKSDKMSMKSDVNDVWLFIIASILLNLVVSNAFFRIDITGPKSYSLSQASKEVVKTLEEPMGIKVFFSDNLPAPYSNINQYVKDILGEYKTAANKNFSVEYFDMEKSDNQRIAFGYGLQQNQIREVKNTEVGFKNAFMGLVITYADQIEKLDNIVSTDGFEYNLTTKIGKVISNTNILSGLGDTVTLTLYKSSALEKFNIGGFSKIDSAVDEAFQKANKKFQNRILLKKENPDKAMTELVSEKYGMQSINYRDADGSENKGTIGLVLEYGDKFSVIPLDIQNAIFQYVVTGLDELEDNISSSVESLVSKTTAIAYISGHEERNLYEENDCANFSSILDDTYTLEQVNLTEKDIPVGVKTAIINGPKTAFSEEELYKLDQFIMRGGSLMLFLDSYDEKLPEGQMAYYQQPSYAAVRTGLEKLLSKHGIEISPTYVMDENCYVQNHPQYGKLDFYYAPLLKKDQINQKNIISKNLGFVLFMQSSPIDVSNAEKHEGFTTTVLAKSSPKTWCKEVSEGFVLSPVAFAPPTDKSAYKAENLAVLLEGKFESAFQTAPKAESEGELNAQNHIMKSTQNGKIFVSSTSAITSGQLISKKSTEPVALFLRNAVDYMSGKEEFCAMRTKALSLNTLKSAKPAVVVFAKYFNQVGLPLLVVLAGLFVYLARKRRRESIRLMYNPDDTRTVQK